MPSGSRNFWVLQDYLPAESREHVKKFIATHYYFEGRGSETTLTRAENIEYAKTLNAFAAYHPGAEISVPQNQNSGNPETTQNREHLAVNDNAKQNPGTENNGTDKTSPINLRVARQFESSEHKFKRLMKESEECLKISGKLI